MASTTLEELKENYPARPRCEECERAMVAAELDPPSSLSDDDLDRIAAEVMNAAKLKDAEERAAKMARRSEYVANESEAWSGGYMDGSLAGSHNSSRPEAASQEVGPSTLIEDIERQRSVPHGNAKFANEGVNPKDLHGVKKVSLGLILSSALIHEARAMENGAKKYGPFNWRDKKIIASVYTNAALRHILAWSDGEEVAADSGVHHLGHARACLGILLDAIECDSLKDDRAPGPASKLLKRFDRSTKK